MPRRRLLGTSDNVTSILQLGGKFIAAAMPAATAAVAFASLMNSAGFETTILMMPLMTVSGFVVTVVLVVMVLLVFVLVVVELVVSVLLVTVSVAVVV